MQNDDRTNPHWSRTPAGKFHRLILVDSDKLGLNGVSGIIVAWHGGIKPDWVYVDKSKDIGRDLDALMDNDDITAYEGRGGIFVAWALVRPEYQDGVLKYLLASMNPIIDNPRPPKKGVTPLPVYAPGQEPRA